MPEGFEDKRIKGINYDSISMEELRLFLITYNDLQAENIKTGLIGIIKKDFSTIFQIEPNYTFEELKNRVLEYSNECKKIFNEIERLHKTKEELLLRYKNSKRDRDFYLKLAEQSDKIENENKRYNKCMGLLNVLENQEIRNELINYLDELTTIQFSKKKPTKHELTKLVFEFLWIANQITHHYNKNAESGIFNKIKRQLTNLISVSGKSDETQKHFPQEKLQHIISEAEKSIAGNDFERSKMIYKKILHVYPQIPHDLRKLIYKPMFNLWFSIYFQNRG
ncbi:MAG TPA: hypothetical protein VI564_08010 [Candidatus Nanoarchaeia archaeon]|nr:hypothetical protein [Candidatus Nanoarchaeia archaeon]